MDSIIDSLKDEDILALTLYGESRGEPIEGIIAVGCVIRNRLSGQSYKDICLAPKQFSCWNKYDINYPLLLTLGQKIVDNERLTDKYFIQCEWVAHGIFDETLLDNVNGARNYLTLALFNSKNKPSWASNAQVETVRGNQIFLNI